MPLASCLNSAGRRSRCSAELLGGERRNSGEAELLAFGEGNADLEVPLCRAGPTMSLRIGEVDHRLFGHEGRRGENFNRLPPRVRGGSSHSCLERAGTDLQNAMRSRWLGSMLAWILGRSRSFSARRLHLPGFSVGAGRAAKGDAHEVFGAVRAAEIVHRRAEEHRGQFAPQVGCRGRTGRRRPDQFHVGTQLAANFPM